MGWTRSLGPWEPVWNLVQRVLVWPWGGLGTWVPGSLLGLWELARCRCQSDARIYGEVGCSFHSPSLMEKVSFSVLGCLGLGNG